MFSDLTESSGMVAGGIVLLLLLLYIMVFRATPYCDSTPETTRNAERCSAGGWYGPLSCRPCPLNAQCSDGLLVI